MEAATEPPDVIKNAIEREIETYGRSNFSAHLQSIRVKAPPGFNNKVFDIDTGIFIGYKKYDEDLDEATILYGRHYSSITSWVSLLKPMSFSKEEQMRMQRDWWQKTGKAFRLLDLPEELRVNVYRHAFGSIIEAYPNNEEHSLLAGSTVQHEAKISQRSSTNLLFVNKFVHKESKKALAMYSHFRLSGSLAAARFVSNDIHTLWVRNIVIDLSHFNFFAVFGLQKYGMPGGGTVPNWDPADLAMQSFNLSSLEIIIGPPRGLLSEHSSTDNACQTKMVDWILDIIWPGVKGQPVIISGFVKPLQKAQFEARAAIEHRRFIEWRDTKVVEANNPAPILPVTTKPTKSKRGKKQSWSHVKKGSIDKMYKAQAKAKAKRAAKKILTPGAASILPPRVFYDALEENYGPDLIEERARIIAEIGPRGYTWPPRCTCTPPCSEETWEAI